MSRVCRCSFRAAVLALLVFSLGGAARAQAVVSYPIPNATVGVPYVFNFGEGLGDIAAVDGFVFRFSFSSSNPPPGLTMAANGALSGTPTQPGSFTFDVDFAYHLEYMGQAYDFTYPYPISLLVTGSATQAKPKVDPGGLSFAFSQGATAASAQTITISNPSSQPLTFMASAQISGGGSWLTLSPSAGTIAPFSSAQILVSALPSALVPGAYVGSVSISTAPGDSSFTVPVIATVTSTQQSIVLSQTGARFQAVQGGAGVQTQAVTVFNGGAGIVSYSVAASTTSGGNWLSVSPAGGQAGSSATAASQVTITANPAGLAPGDYYGQVSFSAPGATNSPQTVSVVLNVVTPANSPGATVSPTGLIFIGSEAGAAPAPKSFTVSNPSPAPLSFATSAFSESGTPFFTVVPASGMAVSGQPVAVSVQPQSGIARGVYRGEVEVRFSDSTFRRVAVVLIVIPGSSTPGSAAGYRTLATGCSPTKLIPVFTQLGSGFKVSAGWPVPLEVTVLDDCGTFLTAGSVVTNFSSGDPALSLSSQKDGRWTGTWQPRSTSSSQVTVTANAQQVAPPLAGSDQIGGGLQPNPAVPIIAAGGALSAASYAKSQPLAPGSFIAIFGSNLSSGAYASPKLPFDTQLGGTQVILGGRQLPLQIANNGQINAIVPYDVPPNSVQQLIVQQNSAVSVPEPVTMASAQPAVFSLDQSGTGAGAILDVEPDGTQFLTDAAHPAAAGDVLVIYCSGLGPVNSAVPAGAAAPADPPARTMNPVTVTIGGQPAQVDFAGLTPGYAGLYQVNVVVPAGVTPGNSIPVVLTVSGLQSVAVTIAVK